MKTIAIVAITVLVGLSASIAGAQEQPRRVRTATICVDPAGRALPPSCRVPASRIGRQEDMCLCPLGDKVAAPICPSGVRPPPESRELELARRKAVDEGSLIGATFEGQPICVKG